MKLELNRRDLQEPVREHLQQHCWLLATRQRNMLKHADYRLEKYCLVGFSITVPIYLAWMISAFCSMLPWSCVR